MVCYFIQLSGIYNYSLRPGTVRGHQWPNVNLYSAVIAGEDTTVDVVPRGDTKVAVVAG